MLRDDTKRLKQWTTLTIGLPTRDVGRTREQLVNHEPKASDLPAFRLFSQHPKWVINLVNP